MNTCEAKAIDTWNHEHRQYISVALKMFSWFSLLEIGCGQGANLVNILRFHPKTQLGGMDENPEAIELIKKSFKGGIFKVNKPYDIMMSDKASDVILSDMMLSKTKRVKRCLMEFKRIARTKIVMFELYDKRWSVRLLKGLHNYPKLLDKLGFYDILIYRVKTDWENQEPQRSYGHIIIATPPKRI